MITRRLALAMILCAGGASASQSGEPAKVIAVPPSAANCPETSPQLAGNGSSWRRQPLKPQKLGELPPADAFAAVYREDERGCMVPVYFRDVTGGR